MGKFFLSVALLRIAGLLWVSRHLPRHHLSRHGSGLGASNKLVDLLNRLALLLGDSSHHLQHLLQVDHVLAVGLFNHGPALVKRLDLRLKFDELLADGVCRGARTQSHCKR